MKIAGLAAAAAASRAEDALRAASDLLTPRAQDPMQSALHAWDKAATQLHERMTRAKRDLDSRNQPQQKKVEVLQELLRELRKTEDPASQTLRDIENDLEEALKELHLPYRAGWLFRVSYSGVMLGLMDFSVERCCASLQVSLLPGRQASGAQQAALLRIVLDASGGGDKSDRSLSHSISVRLERLRLERLREGFSLLPGSFEVASLTIALRCVMQLTFAFGSDQQWVSSEKRALTSINCHRVPLSAIHCHAGVHDVEARPALATHRKGRGRPADDRCTHALAPREVNAGRAAETHPSSIARRARKVPCRSD